MAIEFKQSFEVDVPIDVVWNFVMDPHKVSACMPGAKLEEVIDEKTFLGSVRIKVGAISAGYKGRVEFTDVDAAAYTLSMTAEGRETGGGTAKGVVANRLRELPGGGTECVTEATVDLTGKIMQVGRGMIEGVSQQLFQQFVAKAKKELEAGGTGKPAAGATAPGTSSAAAAPAAKEDGSEAIAVIPLLLKTLWAAIVGFFRRLFGK